MLGLACSLALENLRFHPPKVPIRLVRRPLALLPDLHTPFARSSTRLHSVAQWPSGPRSGDNLAGYGMIGQTEALGKKGAGPQPE